MGYEGVKRRRKVITEVALALQQNFTINGFAMLARLQPRAPSVSNSHLALVVPKGRPPYSW